MFIYRYNLQQDLSTLSYDSILHIFLRMRMRIFQITFLWRRSGQEAKSAHHNVFMRTANKYPRTIEFVTGTPVIFTQYGGPFREKFQKHFWFPRKHFLNYSNYVYQEL